MKSYKRLIAVMIAIVMALSLAACGSSGSSSGEEKSVIVGSKDFTENEIGRAHV